VQAGKLRERVTIQRETVTRDSFGAEVNPWKDVATVWASVRARTIQSTGETFVATADQVLATISHTVRIRQRAGLSPKMRLLWGNRVLQIEAISDPTGRKAEMLLQCQEIVETLS